MRFSERPQIYNFKVADDDFSGYVQSITSDGAATTVVFTMVDTTLPPGSYRYDNGRIYLDPVDRKWKYTEKVEGNHNFSRS